MASAYVRGKNNRHNCLNRFCVHVEQRIWSREATVPKYIRITVMATKSVRVKYLPSTHSTFRSMAKPGSYILYFITAHTQEKHLKIYSKRRSCFFSRFLSLCCGTAKIDQWKLLRRSSHKHCRAPHTWCELGIFYFFSGETKTTEKPYRITATQYARE